VTTGIENKKERGEDDEKTYSIDDFGRIWLK
jgi:hypothetical protein